MSDSIKIFVGVILVALVAVLLALLMPVSTLLELFLIVVGALVIAAGSLAITRETDKLLDLRHRLWVQRTLRERDLQSIKRRPIPPGVRSQYERRRRRRKLY